MGSKQRHETDEDSSMEWKTRQVNNLSLVLATTVWEYQLQNIVAEKCTFAARNILHHFAVTILLLEAVETGNSFAAAKQQLCSDIHTFAATNMLHFTATILLLAAVKTGSSFAAAKINFAVTNILLFLPLQNS